MAAFAIAASNEPDDIWSGWTRFVPRLSLRDHRLLAEFAYGTLAKPLLQARWDAQLVLEAHREPLRRVLLEPEAWRNERPRAERPPEFNRLGAASLRGTLDPASLRTASASELVDYVEPFLLNEDGRGADAVLLPSHVAGGHGEAAREGELRLADAGLQLVEAGAYAHRGDRPKPVLLGVTLDVARLGSAPAAVNLARSYAALGGDGYWVQLARLTEAAAVDTVTAAATFLFALEGLSGRRVFAVDCKNLVWPILAAGLWGACIGVGEREQFDGPDAASTKRRSIQPTVIHPRLLRNFRVGGDQARAAFAAFPCDCEAHPAHEVPESKPAIRRHALRVRLGMSRQATGQHAVATVQRWLTDAGWAAADLGLDQPAVAAYQAVFDAADWSSAASL